MKVLVDTSVWSHAFRKKNFSETDQIILKVLKALIKLNSVVIFSAIRQEILSGISSEKLFIELKNSLRAFEDVKTNTSIYELATEYFNVCRKNGIQGSHTDYSICAVATFYNLEIFTLDKDFNNYTKYIPIKLYEFN